MGKIIEVAGLTKSYGQVRAVRGIDFYVQEGAFFAFLGPNGAGKSTTIDIICTLLAPDSGTVTVNGYTLGKDDDRIRSHIGVVFQHGMLDDLLTVRENLALRASFYGFSGAKLREQVQQAAQAAEVEDFLTRPYGKLSGGQKRRADIARALVHTPRVLFLDEPTAGLDPQTRKHVWQTIRNLQQEQGMTVFMTTHYMEEAANADYVAVINHGKIRAKGRPAELREQYSSDFLKLSFKELAPLEALLSNAQVDYEVVGKRVEIKLRRTLDALPLLTLCEAHLTGFEVVSGSLDDAFIAITGGELRA